MPESTNFFIKKNPNVQWLLEEIGVVLGNYQHAIDTAVESNARRLVPYFTHALTDENPEVQHLAKKGLKAAKDALNRTT